jgi:hypothetical protein
LVRSRSRKSFAEGLGDKGHSGHRGFTINGEFAMDIDRQRIAAVRALERLGYGYSHRTGDWLPPASPPLPLIAEADAMHGALMRWADALAGCKEGSDEEAELKAIVDAIEA